MPSVLSKVQLEKSGENVGANMVPLTKLGFDKQWLSQGSLMHRYMYTCLCP